MDRHGHVVVVEGLDAHDVALASLRDLTAWLADGIDAAMRLRIEGRSRARGPHPSWLTASRDVHVRELRAGSLQLVLDSPPLIASHPDLFRQGDLFVDAPRPIETPYDVFVESVRDAVDGNVDSDRVDAGLLEILLRAGSLFTRGVSAIRFLEGPVTLVLRREDLTRVQEFARLAPEPRLMRVIGDLDSIRMSTGAFWILPQGRPALRGIMNGRVLEAAKSLLGERVAVEGVVTFKASRQPLRIEATALRVPTDADMDWTPLGRAPGRRASLPPPEGSFLAGDWPGDESDDEVDAALRTIS